MSIASEPCHAWTCSDASDAEGCVSRFEFGELEQMSGRDFVAMPSAEVRRKWIKASSDHMNNSLTRALTPITSRSASGGHHRERAARQNTLDILQEKIESAWSGSFGIARDPVDTALKDKLIPEDDPFRLAKACGMERVFVKGRLKVSPVAMTPPRKRLACSWIEWELILNCMAKELRAGPKEDSSRYDIYGSFDAGSQEEGKLRSQRLYLRLIILPIPSLRSTQRRIKTRRSMARTPPYSQSLLHVAALRPLCP